MKPKKATGFRGSWFATVDDQSLPCVHKHWWVNREGSAYYDDTGLRPSPHNDAFVEAIRDKHKVILTSDKPYLEEVQAPFKRTGYIAVFAVSDVEFDEKGLRFKFVERLCSLK